jgi:hypothetical protein
MAAGVVAAVGGKVAATGITRSLTRAPEHPGHWKRYPGCSVRLLSARFRLMACASPLRTLTGHQCLTAPSDLTPPPYTSDSLPDDSIGDDMR